MSIEGGVLRTQLTQLLLGGQAHADVASALADFPFELTGERPGGLPDSAWQLLEHMRLALHDLLEFVTNSEYEASKWPDDYWPKEAKPPSPDAWEKSVAALQANVQAFVDIVADENSNLYDTIPWADEKQTLLREVLLAADHTSYHLGELIIVRRLIGAWKK
jgi:uncharacterized damage-inducible protein DinB